MDLTTRLTARLAFRLRKLRGTLGSFTTDLGRVFYQAASYPEDAVLIEITGEQFLPRERRLTIAQQERLLALGFTRPDSDMPNWWIGLEDSHDRNLFAAARAVITALIEVHGVSTDALGAELPLYRYDARWTPLAQRRGAGANPSGARPSGPELMLVETRLALLEQFALTCITTGSLYHEHLFQAAAALNEGQGATRASGIVGWEKVDRLDAGERLLEVFDAQYAADTYPELYECQRRVWEALQDWVRISPWGEDFDFEIMVGEPDPDVEIQRVYRA